MITPQEIKETLSKSLPVLLVEAQDLTGGGDHWQVIIVSPAFEGKGLVEQHRMVNEALKEAIGDQRIHALALKTYSPVQWQKLGA
ncbi:MAG: BolA family transcriptional regulator [Deltaproteobacteria bacterium]|nr:BolA family transcriptional regulator [Deltaproteobacteria bacterium]MBI3065578.1 BolA family transcriptional regulator [Deltaproteobacteria bacterium]